MSDKANICIRIAKETDVPRLVEIYAYYVSNTNVSFEYEPPTIEEFTKRVVGIIKKFPYLVAEMDGKVVGYSYANTYRPRQAYDWCVETTVYLDKEYFGYGIGRKLYQKLETYLRSQHILNLYACIVYPYSDSVEFHKKMGYKQIGHFPNCGYKFEQWHDMIFMEKSIGEHEVPMKKVIPFEELRAHMGMCE